MQLFNLVIIGIGRAGVELAMIISVERDVENTGVSVEHLLGSVTVVNVPVQDHHPVQPKLGGGVPGGDGHVVQEAEPRTRGLICVVTWRSHHGPA